MWIILSYQVFRFVWLNFRVDKLEFGKRRVIFTRGLLPQTSLGHAKLAWRLAWYVCARVYHFHNRHIILSTVSFSGYRTATAERENNAINADLAFAFTFRKPYITATPPYGL